MEVLRDLTSDDDELFIPKGELPETMERLKCLPCQPLLGMRSVEKEGD